MKRAVVEAIEELRAAFPDSSVTFVEDAEGGASVRIEPVDIGPGFEPRRTWIGFHITWPYPDADVYPLFIDGMVKYVGSRAAPNAHPEGALPVPMSRGATMPGFERPAIQISRRSNRRDPETDSAARKALRVIEFLRTL